MILYTQMLAQTFAKPDYNFFIGVKLASEFLSIFFLNNKRCKALVKTL